MTVAALVLSMGILSGGGAATRDPWIVFVGSSDGATKPFQLFRVRLSGSGFGPVTDGRRNADDPAFSPDGRELVFTRVGEGIFAVKPDGTKLRRLTPGLEVRSLLGGRPQSISIGLNALFGDAPPAWQPIRP